MPDPVKKFTLAVTEYQMEILEEALIGYIEDSDSDEAWVAPTQDLLEQVREDDEPWISAPNVT